MDQKNRMNYLLLLSSAGLVIAVLTGLESHIQWLASFCGFFGDGCRDTMVFKVLGLSVWLWGVAYYAALTGVVLFFRPAVFWLVIMGLGMELRFAWIMATMHFTCIFCLMNAVLVIALVVFCLEKNRLWPGVAVSLLVFILSEFLFSGSLPVSAQARLEKQGKTVVARVGDEAITASELENPLSTRIYKLQQDMYTLKQDYLQKLINDILLRKEAGEKGMSVDQLVDSLSPDKEPVQDEDVEAYYWQNRSHWFNWKGTTEDLKNRIRSYLQEEKKKQRIAQSAETLRNKYPVTVYLREPLSPSVSISIGDSPVSGPEDARVTIVEFSDYLCPACRSAHATVKKIRDLYAGKIRWVFKDYPLKRHEGARKIAESAHCAGDQGRFWEFQDKLYAFTEEKLETRQLTEAAGQLGLDVARFTQCYASGKYGSKITHEIENAGQAGINATPTFIVNGRLYPGAMSVEDFKQKIDEALGKDRAGE